MCPCFLRLRRWLEGQVLQERHTHTNWIDGEWKVKNTLKHQFAVWTSKSIFYCIFSSTRPLSDALRVTLTHLGAHSYNSKLIQFKAARSYCDTRQFPLSVVTLFNQKVDFVHSFSPFQLSTLVSCEPLASPSCLCLCMCVDVLFPQFLLKQLPVTVASYSYQCITASASLECLLKLSMFFLLLGVLWLCCWCIRRSSAQLVPFSQLNMCANCRQTFASDCGNWREQ